MARLREDEDRKAARGSYRTHPERAPKERKSFTGLPLPTPEPRDYAEILTQYAQDVVCGRIPAGRYVRLACKRHLDDVKRSEADPSYPFAFDRDTANAWCAKIEQYPHIKGRWAARREFIKLEPWQCFLNGVPFGWRRRVDGVLGRRRFREIYAEIPRKNAKSTTAACIGNNLFLHDGEFGAEVYAGATSEKQAWEVFGPAKLMLERAPEIRDENNVEVWKKAMVKADDNSRFWPVIGKPGDGASPSCAIVDEYHEHATPDLYDTMISGMGAREQPMMVVITTAGTSLAGPCYDKHLQVKKLLEGALVNDELFGIIYSIDLEQYEWMYPDGRKVIVPPDDWADPASLVKANPNYGISVDGEFLQSQQRQAVLNAESQNRFKTKHLNVWCSAKTAWMNMQWWNLCGDAGLSIDEFEGQPCWFILDLASRNDLCVFMQLFRARLNGQSHYYGFGRYYLPEVAIEEPGPNQSSYRKWVNQGLLTATEGTEIDFDFIRDEVISTSKRFQVIEVVYDQWRAVHLAHQLMKEGATCVEFPQRVQTMSLPMKELMAAVKSCRFHHNGDPIMTWAMSNVVAKEDAKENIYPRKEKNHLKIDPVVGLIMGFGRAIASDDSAGVDDWLKNGPVVVA